MTDVRAELKIMREQITSDFQVTWKLMGETADRVESMSQEIARQGRETAERLRQVEGRMRLVEQRVGKFLEVVDEGLARLDGRVEDHEVRLQRLEEGQTPAA